MNKIKDLFGIDWKTPKNDYKVLLLLEKLLNIMFSNFVVVNISKRKLVVIKKNTHPYYYVSLNISKLIEIICLSHEIDKKYYNIIKTNYSNETCKYKEITQFNTIGDMLK